MTVLNEVRRMEIVLNEKEYAIKHLETGQVDSKPFFTLSIIAKYYYHCLHYKKSKIITLLTDFLSKNYAGYHDRPLEWQSTIEELVNKVDSYNLLEAYGVSISNSEIKTISDLHNKNLELVMFVILCLAKLENLKKPNNNGWVNIDTKEVFEYARVSCKAIERENYICKLRTKGLLQLPKRNDNMSVRVTFIEDKIDKENEVLFVSDFKELGYEYLKHKGDNVIECAKCGTLTRGNKSGTKRYCKNCITYMSQGTKKITCIDCGKVFEVSSKNTQSCRCYDCQNRRTTELNRIASRERMRKHRTSHTQ